MDLYTYKDPNLSDLKDNIVEMIDDITDIQGTVKDLKIEFNKLFALFLDDKEAIPLFASYYLNSQSLIFTEETIKVKEFYRENGYKVIGEEFVPEDSLVLEFGFMANLINEMLSDVENEDFICKSLEYSGKT